MELDEIVYGTPSLQQLKTINKHTYLDDLFAELTAYTFPKNSSVATREELNVIIKRIDELKPKEEIISRYQMYDQNLSGFFMRWLVSKNADAEDVKELINNLLTDINPLLYKLKYFHQRPRPRQLAPYYKLKLFPFDSNSADSPSFPSGHAFQSKIICEVLGNRYPQIYDFMRKLADDISFSRLFMGLHYQSDIDTAIYCAERVLDNKEFKLRYQL